jgi:hypothetical protein
MYDRYYITIGMVLEIMQIKFLKELLRFVESSLKAPVS